MEDRYRRLTAWKVDGSDKQPLSWLKSKGLSADNVRWNQFKSRSWYFSGSTNSTYCLSWEWWILSIWYRLSNLVNSEDVSMALSILTVMWTYIKYLIWMMVGRRGKEDGGGGNVTSGLWRRTSFLFLCCAAESAGCLQPLRHSITTKQLLRLIALKRYTKKQRGPICAVMRKWSVGNTWKRPFDKEKAQGGFFTHVLGRHLATWLLQTGERNFKHPATVHSEFVHTGVSTWQMMAVFYRHDCFF